MPLFYFQSNHVTVLTYIGLGEFESNGSIEVGGRTKVIRIGFGEIVVCLSIFQFTWTHIWNTGVEDWQTTACVADQLQCSLKREQIVLMSSCCATYPGL